MSGQGVGEHVFGTLLPDSVQLVLAKFQHEALQSGAFDLVECVAVDDRDQRTMVGVHGEMHTGQKQLTLVHCPDDGEKLEFDDGVPCLGVREETASTVNEAPFVILKLPQRESEAVEG